MYALKNSDDYKYFLNNSQLKDGDIILTASNDIFSKGIQYATGGNYSHALMMFNQVSYIHAVPKSKENTEGVQVGNIQRMFFQDKKYVCVLRLKEYEKMQNIINKACSFIRGEVAKGYDFLRAIDVKLKTGKIGYDNKKICSQLVAEAYESAGIRLVNDSSNCSPEELKQSDLLEIVDVELCNFDDIPSITRTELAQSSHQKVHYEIEKKAIISLRNLNRKELSDIYTTKHILNFLAKHQNYDDKEITKCFSI
nr:YiiX/YebB-like N1pC/P60 family cysteine hydrolase [uncultured Haemophilus sp.]